MNMGELAALAAQKAAMAGGQNNDYSPLADDSPDLKTPTAEDIVSVPEHKVLSTKLLGIHNYQYDVMTLDPPTFALLTLDPKTLDLNSKK